MSQRRRSILLVGVLALGAAGCELVASFDRSEIDAGPLPTVDGSTEDSSTDGSPKDTNQPDTTLPDGGADTNAPDTNQPDTNQPDTNQPDGNDAGTDANDANVPDTNVSDTNVPDTNVSDTNVPDTNVPDTNVPDTNEPDTNVPDTNVPDSNDGAAACNALDPSTATPVTLADSTGTPPTLGGGTIPTSGTFMLTNDTYYSADGGVAPTGTRKYFVTFSAAGAEGALINPGGDLVRYTGSFDTPSGNMVNESFSCGLTGSVPVTYDVSGTTGARVLVLTIDNVEYQTFTEQ